MALLYILLVSSFFGWAAFSRTRDITQPDGSSESLVHLLEGDGINSELKKSTLGVKVYCVCWLEILVLLCMCI